MVHQMQGISGEMQGYRNELNLNASQVVLFREIEQLALKNERNSGKCLEWRCAGRFEREYWPLRRLSFYFLSEALLNRDDSFKNRMIRQCC